ncbi:MAG: hypothetical protein ACXADW_10860 [Candidatus Hodarchaeales archaeon]|jgi:hypothetical protein
MDIIASKERVRTFWPSKGFGNALIMAHITYILNDNGIESYFSPNRATDGLVDVPIYSEEIGECVQHMWQPTSHYYKKNIDKPTLIRQLDLISKTIQRKIVFDTQRHNYIPVKFKEEKAPSADVVMCTKVGTWQPYRQWSYFDTLKKILSKCNISYVDLHEENIFSNKCLNYVNNAKLYLGMDTGMSHYVSKFANGKALILQSGISPFYYWAYPYDYDYMKANYTCVFDPCFINKNHIKAGTVCTYNNVCMTSLTVEQVLYEIRERI